MIASCRTKSRGAMKQARMPHEILRRDAERGVMNSFRGAYRQATGQWIELEAEREAPDFILRDPVGALLGAEVTVVYYGTDDAKALWDAMRGNDNPTVRAIVNPEIALIAQLDEALVRKSEKDYGASCILLVHLDAPLTGCADFESAILPAITVPPDPSPFSAIYLRMRVHDLVGVELVWWELRPDRRRFAEVAFTR
jgi:hypothetical protein